MLNDERSKPRNNMNMIKNIRGTVSLTFTLFTLTCFKNKSSACDPHSLVKAGAAMCNGSAVRGRGLCSLSCKPKLWIKLGLLLKVFINPLLCPVQLLILQIFFKTAALISSLATLHLHRYD